MGTSLVQGQVILFISPDGTLGRVELKNETSDENDPQKNNIEQKCRNVCKSQKVYAKDSETVVIKKKINLNEILIPPLLN